MTPPRWGTHRDAAPPAIRRAVLERDGYRCTYTDAYGRCTQRATDVHHVTAHADHGSDDPTNLVSLCAWHHKRITATEGAHARWSRTKRDTPKHPGLR